VFPSGKTLICRVHSMTRSRKRLQDFPWAAARAFFFGRSSSSVQPGASLAGKDSSEASSTMSGGFGVSADCPDAAGGLVGRRVMRFEDLAITVLLIWRLARVWLRNQAATMGEGLRQRRRRID
jgi:hypothetical protein